MSCLWKITADSCFLVASFPERYCCMLVVAALAEGKNVTGNKILEKDELYTLAARYVVNFIVIDLFFHFLH